MENYQDILGVNVSDIVKKGQFSTKKRKQILCLLTIICFGFCAFYFWHINSRATRATQAIEKVINSINSDPKGMAASISNAIQLYNNLAEEEKALISDSDAAVLKVAEAIDSIKLAPKGSTEAISFAMQLYDDLTKEQQASIPNAPVLIVEEAINSIGTVSMPGSKEVLALSNQLYRKLTETQKLLVSNHEILESATSTYIDLCNADLNNFRIQHKGDKLF